MIVVMMIFSYIIQMLKVIIIVIIIIIVMIKIIIIMIIIMIIIITIITIIIVKTRNLAQYRVHVFWRNLNGIQLIIRKAAF